MQYEESSTHRGHLTGDKVALLRQHVGHHKRWQLSVGVRVDEAIVWQRMTEVARRVMLHQVKKRWLRVVGWSNRRDLIVFVSGPVSTGGTATSTSSPAASCLTRVALIGEINMEINKRRQ